MNPTIKQISSTSIFYLPPLQRINYAVYYILLILTITGLIALPFVHTTIAVTAQGIIRPASERTDVKTVIGGIIDTLYFHEGNSIKKGAILLRLKDRVTQSKKILGTFQINQRSKFIHDLQLLTTSKLNDSLGQHLLSPLYKEQLNRYLYQKTDYDETLRKAAKDFNINSKLLEGKAITKKEFFDVQVQYNKAIGTSKAFVEEQQSNWQQDLAQYKVEYSQYKEQQNQVNTDASFYEVRAPVSGTLQDINTRYSGGLIQPNETLCTISPNNQLIGECYLTTKDIGLIKAGQIVHFQVDAFNYNYFGILTGKVISIDNDFTTINNSTIFKVRCTFDATQLHLKNGYSGDLKKGLTFQARFLIGERSLWQLLWDNLDDWLNPNAPQNNS